MVNAGSHTLLVRLSIVLLCMMTSLSIAASQAVRERLQGEYSIRRSAMAREGEARISAIQQAVATLEPTLAKRWSGMLEAMTTPQGKIRITIMNGEIAIAEGDRSALKSAASGTERAINDYTRLHQRVEGAAVIKRVTLVNLEGRPLPSPLAITTRHTLSPDQRTLTVHTRVEGGQLTQAIELSTTYDRM